jgi:hypothetical protein
VLRGLFPGGRCSGSGLENQEKGFNAKGSEGRYRVRGDIWGKDYGDGLAEIGYFFVEVGEGGFEGLLVVGMGGGGEIVHDVDAR